MVIKSYKIIHIWDCKTKPTLIPQKLLYRIYNIILQFTQHHNFYFLYQSQQYSIFYSFHYILSLFLIASLSLSPHHTTAATIHHHQTKLPHHYDPPSHRQKPTTTISLKPHPTTHVTMTNTYHR